MLDLEVQSAYQPGNNRVVGSEIGRSLDLVDSPLVFHLAGFYVCHGEVCMFHRMRQLKYHAQHKTRYACEDDKADEPALEPDLVYRQTNKKKCME